MIVAIHQPQYLPWLGYFDKMRRADMFCFLDNVQYKKNDWQNRNRLKTDQGWQWLTVPVCNRFPQKINEVKICHEGTRINKQKTSLITAYTKAPFLHDHLGFIEKTFLSDTERLIEINLKIIMYLFEQFHSVLRHSLYVT